MFLVGEPGPPLPPGHGFMTHACCQHPREKKTWLMSKPRLPVPDLTQGIALAEFTKRDAARPMWGDQEIPAGTLRGPKFSPSTPIAVTYHGPARGWPRGRRPVSAVPGIMPASTLRTGEAGPVPPAAETPLAVWQVEQQGEKNIRPAQARAAEAARQKARSMRPAGSFIVGGGAAGFARGRRCCGGRISGGSIVMLSSGRRAAGRSAKTWSKDYLSPVVRRRIGCRLRPGQFLYRKGPSTCASIADVTAIDAKARHVVLAGGTTVSL